jgi:hypothetical protein
MIVLVAVHCQAAFAVVYTAGSSIFLQLQLPSASFLLHTMGGALYMLALWPVALFASNKCHLLPPFSPSSAQIHAEIHHKSRDSTEAEIGSICHPTETKRHQFM